MAGRPTKYKPEYVDLAYKFCLLGATDADLAKNFDVSVDTITEWKSVHPEFSASIKEGKDEADAIVADRLFKRATGYDCPDCHVSVIKGKVIVTPLRKHYPPDTTAAIFWLKNRQKENWRDKQEIEHKGTVEIRKVERVVIKPE